MPLQMQLPDPRAVCETVREYVHAKNPAAQPRAANVVPVIARTVREPIFDPRQVEGIARDPNVDPRQLPPVNAEIPIRANATNAQEYALAHNIHDAQPGFVEAFWAMHSFASQATQ
jgi:hypothetical protein